ncbi:MAG: DNA polymerase II small subunit [Methanobacteriota archaeon]|nr:MAG: DNA polymerase II small subunit [Euryarchaeota archaeon]
MRYNVEAHEAMQNLEEEMKAKVEEYLKKRDISIVRKDDVENAIKVIKKPIVEVKRASHYKPVAKEYESDIIIDHKRDVTGKSRTKGSAKDFVRYFQNRFKRMRSLFGPHTSEYSEMLIGDLSKANGEKVSIIAMVSEKRESRSGNTVLSLEDLTGKAVAVANKNDERVMDKIALVTKEDTIRVYCKVKDKLLLVEDLEFPDVRERVVHPTIEKDVAVAYLSDIHLGSRFCLEDMLNRFMSWIREPSTKKELAGKIKYIVVAGDVVDGIGIYPGQEKELSVKDIYGQYELFDKLLEELPDYIDVVVSPGNHDAVRRAEPMPALKESFFSNKKPYLVGNPGVVHIEGFKHLIYHGTSMDSLVANIRHLTYHKVEPIMREYFRRRHLSPIYGTNPIVPEEIDYMVMDKVPHVFHCGHIHKNGQALYKGVLMLNSGTFQDQTPFQIKQGHIPTPGNIPVYNLNSKKLSIVDVRSL